MNRTGLHHSGHLPVVPPDHSVSHPSAEEIAKVAPISVIKMPLAVSVLDRTDRSSGVSVETDR